MHYAEHETMKYYPSEISFEDIPVISPMNTDIQTEFDLGFTYLVNDMDREAMDVFTRLINDDNEHANALALRLATLYNS